MQSQIYPIDQEPTASDCFYKTLEKSVCCCCYYQRVNSYNVVNSILFCCCLEYDLKTNYCRWNCCGICDVCYY
jgi:hypothetical protein